MKKGYFFLGAVLSLGIFWGGFSVAKAADQCCLSSDSSGSWSCTDVSSGSCSGILYDGKCSDSTNASTCNTMTGSSSSSGTSSGSNSSMSFPNPLKYDSISAFLTAFLENLQGIVATIAVIFIVVGGIMYMLSAGDPKMITRAKDTIFAAIIGLAIVLAAPTFLKEVRTILGATGSSSGDQSIDSALSLLDIADNVLTFLLSIVGILAIISMVIGATMYLMAYGDDDRIKTGKQIIKYSLIGIAVALAALILVEQVGTLIGNSQ